MKTLLGKLQLETFVLSVAQPVARAPQIAAYPIRRVDDTTLEVDVNKGQGLNALFASLSDAGIEVLSLRGKSNRLEELFVRLVENGQAGGGGPGDSAGTSGRAA